MIVGGDPGTTAGFWAPRGAPACPFIVQRKVNVDHCWAVWRIIVGQHQDWWGHGRAQWLPVLVEHSKHKPAASLKAFPSNVAMSPSLELTHSHVLFLLCKCIFVLGYPGAAIQL